ncbi:MAG: PilZ domain-containing protein [Hylemonella sp.]|nr:PilZ domain-containing protein [Hylemonella sp.]
MSLEENTPAGDAADRRQHKRADFFVTAHVAVSGRDVAVQMHDFSLKGARVAHDGSDWKPREGDACVLHVDLGRAAVIVMDATVSRVDGNFIGLHSEVPASLKSKV